MAKSKGISSQRVAQLTLAHQSARKTGELLGISDTSVKYHLRQAGVAYLKIDGRYQWVRLSVGDCVDALKRYQDVDQAANALNVRPNYVRDKAIEGFLEQCQ